MQKYPNLIAAGYCPGALEDPWFGNMWAPDNRCGKSARESAKAIVKELTVRAATQRSKTFYIAKTR